MIFSPQENTTSNMTIIANRERDFENYPEIVEIAPSNNAYNCFSYAFYSTDYNTNCYCISSSEEYVKGRLGADNPDSYDDNAISFVEGDGSVGEILVYYEYHNGFLNDIHAGIIVSNPNNINPNNDNIINHINSIVVNSKWDDSGLYRHNALYCPYYTSGQYVFKSYRPYYDINQYLTIILLYQIQYL